MIEYFRAKTTPKKNPSHEFSNVWVYGDLIHSGKGKYIHPVGNWVNVDGEIGKMIVMHEVCSNTVCRYTGFSDKNGTRIFTNDIVKYKDAVGIVRFGLHNCGEYGFYIEWLGDVEYRKDFGYWLCRTEVIGNVFDNSEILKAGDIHENSV